MRYLVLLLTLIAVVLSFLNYTLYKRQKTIKFVDTAYLYNNFKLKQELEKTFGDIKALKQKGLDSLYEQIASLQNSNSKIEVTALEKLYLHKRSNFVEEQENLRVSYDNQIWKQLNTFVKEFGEENGIDLILGANGEGAVMHGKNDMNISEAMVEFANKKYNGK